MSELWIVVVGTVSVLSAVALVTWFARPPEFRSPSPAISAPLRRSVTIPPSDPGPTPVSYPPRAPSAWRTGFDAGPASLRTISRGAGDQASIWAQPPTLADQTQDAPSG